MYSKFAHEFSKTRTKPWRCVEMYLSDNIKSRSGPAKQPTLLDAGCGNGRNLAAALEAGYEAKGFDICPEFVELCKLRGFNVSVGSIESSIDGTYDSILCIAVLHHLQTEDARQYALQNLYEALNPGGSLLVTVWSYESEGARYPKSFHIGDNIVPWKSLYGKGTSDRYYYIYDKSTLDSFLDLFKRHNPDASVHLTWEEQNWIFEIKKPQ